MDSKKEFEGTKKDSSCVKVSRCLGGTRTVFYGEYEKSIRETERTEEK